MCREEENSCRICQLEQQQLNTARCSGRPQQTLQLQSLQREGQEVGADSRTWSGEDGQNLRVSSLDTHLLSSPNTMTLTSCR